ncbi:MAG: hypothetical protein JNN15_02760 [Blastocatellia bacterium]|nr:hypothetical protein [Blastocatellia bacterium]
MRDLRPVVIKEKTPVRYSLGVGLAASIPSVIGLILLTNVFFPALGSSALFNFFLLTFGAILFPFLIGRGFALEISEAGIRQIFYGKKLFHIHWDEIESVNYIDSFPCPRYRIKGCTNSIISIEIPIEDENFLEIKKALEVRGLVLSQGIMKK